MGASCALAVLNLIWRLARVSAPATSLRLASRSPRAAIARRSAPSVESARADTHRQPLRLLMRERGVGRARDEREDGGRAALGRPLQTIRADADGRGASDEQGTTERWRSDPARDDSPKGARNFRPNT